ncbi:MAG: ribulose-phosphate 3-epimerase [Spirochaetales bacterium]|jgi:ribulose-phosphate 3-epimerase|nr:ribulose-phosphate 3-epimerase [Spirochaetales bacterium]
MSQNDHTLVAASLLSADFSQISNGIITAEKAGADWLHLDVMDGSFVPQITFGPKMVKDIRKHTDLPLDVHLMVEHPETMVEDFIDAGADHISFHLEATVHVHRLLSLIKDAGVRPGISIVPSTPVSALNEVLDLTDIILIMTVNPGFGGQEIIKSCLKKVSSLAELRKKTGDQFMLEVDGGINRITAASAREAGSDVLISGSAFFSSKTPAEEVKIFKGNLED